MAFRVDNLRLSVEEELTTLRSQVAKVKSQAGDVLDANPQGGGTPVCVEFPNVTVDCDSIFNKIDLLQERVNSEILIIKCDIDKALDQLSEMVDSHAQKSNANNVIIYGVEERDEGCVYDSIQQLFTSKLQCRVDKSDVNSVHRIGRKVNGKTRPLVVEFMRKWQRDEIFKLKSKFKGTKIVMVEMLTKQRLELFGLVRKKYGPKCWTHNGEIFLSIEDRIVHIKNKSSLDKVPAPI